MLLGILKFPCIGNSYIAEIDTILDSFHQLVNTTSISFGWWVETVGNYKVAEFPILKETNGKMASIDSVFRSACHKMQPNKINAQPSSLASLLAISLLAVYFAR